MRQGGQSGIYLYDDDEEEDDGDDEEEDDDDEEEVDDDEEEKDEDEGRIMMRTEGENQENEEKMMLEDERTRGYEKATGHERDDMTVVMHDARSGMDAVIGNGAAHGMAWDSSCVGNRLRGR